MGQQTFNPSSVNAPPPGGKVGEGWAVTDQGWHSDLPAGTSTKIIESSGFRITQPPGAGSPLGISISAQKDGSSGVADKIMRLAVSGAGVGNNKASQNWGRSDYGGDNDLWGYAWGWSDLADLSVLVSAKSPLSDGSADFSGLSVTVYY